MQYVITALGILGWYFVLRHFHIGGSSAFTAFNTTFTWFTVLMVVGIAGIYKVCTKLG